MRCLWLILVFALCVTLESVTSASADPLAIEPIRVQPASISLTTVAGKSASAIIRLRKAGTDTHTYTLSTDQPWILLRPVAGAPQIITTEMDTITITAQTDRLGVGSYSGVVSLLHAAPNKSSAVIRIPVSLRVVDPIEAGALPPVISPPAPVTSESGLVPIVSLPSTLSLTAASGQTTSGTLTLTKGGTDVRSYYISTNSPWIWLTPPYGSTQTISTETDTLTVTIHTEGMAPGQYPGVVYLVETGINGYQNMIRVPVLLTVTSATTTTTPSPTIPTPPPPSSGSVSTTSATVRWDPNTEADLAGYRLYIGTQPGAYTYTAPITIPSSSTSYQVHNLVRGTTYYFAITAYDKIGNESGKSGEFSLYLK